MKYHVQFQYLPKGAIRPRDHTSTADVNDLNQCSIPNIGDFVELIALGEDGRSKFSGRVKSRLFRYFGDKNCGINIVVEEVSNEEVNWGLLIKE